MKTTSSVITSLLAHIVNECRAVDREAAFDSMLDECYSFSSVGGPFAHMSPSSVLRECDPTAHRCGVNDYADGMDWTEVDGETYEDSEIEAARESFADTKRDEITAKETELADIEEQASQEDGADWREETAKVKAEIATLETELAEIEGYSF